MELIIINEKKLKVTLSGEEMTKYDLDGLDECACGTRSSLRGMMRDIQMQTGFNSGGEKLYIQLYPCRNGGCELYITVLDTANSVPTHDSINMSEISTTDFGRIRGVIYGFECISDMASACRAAVQQMAGSIHSSAYSDDRGGAFLVLDKQPGNHVSRLLSEFGRPEYGESVAPYICEHWHIIFAQNAAQKLAQY